MITVNNGTVIIPKDLVEFQADLTHILRAGVDHGLITKEDLDYAYELATSSDDELHKRATETLGLMMSKLAESVGEDTAGEMIRSLASIKKEI